MLGRTEIESLFSVTRTMREESSKETFSSHLKIRDKFQELAVWLDVALPDGTYHDEMMYHLVEAARCAHNTITKEKQ